MRLIPRLTVGLAILITAQAASAQPANSFFGYTFKAPLGGPDGVVASIGPVSTSHVFSKGPNVSIVQDVIDASNASGPVVLGVLGLLFKNETVSGINCTHYERGGTSESQRDYLLYGDYRNRVDQFFAVNESIFKGSRKVAALSIHPEINNRCVQAWKISVTANYIRQKLDAVAEYGPIYLAGAYDFGSYNGAGRGFPTATGVAFGASSTSKFPGGLDAIAYFAYDVFNPNQPTHPLNVGADPWASVQTKLAGALHPHQKTIGVLKGFCVPKPPGSDNVDSLWGVSCPTAPSTIPDPCNLNALVPDPNNLPPFQNLWKIGAASQNWSTYLLSDPRNVGVLMFNWRSRAGSGDSYWGTGLLYQLWTYHSSIAAQWAP